MRIGTPIPSLALAFVLLRQTCVRKPAAASRSTGL